MDSDRSIQLRRNVVADSRRVVVKVGSRALTEIDGYSIGDRINQLIQSVAEIRSSDREILLVSSGAIGTGMELSGLTKRPRDLPGLQALAARGQCRLMSLYEDACTECGFHCAQMLLSTDDLKSRERHLNIRHCLNTLLAQKVLPIVNENDSVSVEEISFGDNDRLAALVAAMTRTDLTILLTTVPGLLDDNGQGRTDRISLVEEITDHIRDIAQDTDGNPISTGGMISKIAAAEVSMAAGESLWIADGRDFGVLKQIFAAEDVGTLFYSGSERLSGAKRWLRFFTDPIGEIVVDAGAAAAICTGGKSLLPRGITGIQGDFDKGDTVSVKDSDGRIIGTGLTNYNSGDLGRIQGLKSGEIFGVLGRHQYDEVVHRDSLVVV